ncbi:MAG TPA: hypothetical protein VFW90_02955 [Candidatus Saccharimonadales bacterium]|nr:hypothetical protein [Candidatus Saccharimonadales bacterium]
MKVYVAGRARHRKDDVAEIQEKLKSMGFEIAYDWPAGDSQIKKPYRENRQANLAAQAEMLKTAADADIFILLDDEGLRGAYVELGAFLADCLKNSQGRRAFIVGPDSEERQFIFESPGYVSFADSIEEVYKALADNA